MYNHFRKDNIVLAICISISLIGSLLLIITKSISRKIIQRIPQSNILPQLAINQVESFQMTTFHSTTRIIQVKPISKNDTGPSLQLNRAKYNSNIINLSGICIIGVIYSFSFAIFILNRFGYNIQVSYYFFTHACCFPVLLPTIYFMRNPKHLISVLQDHNLM